MASWKGCRSISADEPASLEAARRGPCRQPWGSSGVSWRRNFPRGKLIRSSVLFSPSQHGLMASLIAHLNSMIKTSPMGPHLLHRGWRRLRFGKGTTRESPRADSLGLCRAGPWPIPGRDASQLRRELLLLLSGQALPLPLGEAIIGSCSCVSPSPSPSSSRSSILLVA